MGGKDLIGERRAAVGIAVTIFVFLVVLTATVLIYLQYDSFIRSTNAAAERAAARANERLIIRAITFGQRIDPNAILVENVGKGPAVSEVVAVLRRDPTSMRVENYTLSKPVSVKLGESVRIDLRGLFAVTEEDQVGVLTSLGNVFWGFTTKVSFIAVKAMDPRLPSNTTMKPEAIILNVDGVDYTVSELFPENGSSGITFLWPAGSQHQFTWATSVEALAQPGIMTVWDYNGTEGLVRLPPSEGHAIFEAPYVDHYVLANYYAELQGMLTVNATWIDTETKENAGVEAANNRVYALQINTTLILRQDLLYKYPERSVTVKFDEITLNGTDNRPRVKPVAAFANGQTSTVVTFTDNETTKLVTASVTSGTFWWNESYDGMWRIPILATFTLPEGGLSARDELTLTLERLNRTKVSFWWIGKADNDNLGITTVSPNVLSVSVTGSPDPLPDQLRGGYYEFDPLPQRTTSQLSLIAGYYETYSPDPLFDSRYYGAPRNFLFWTVAKVREGTTDYEKAVSSLQPMNYYYDPQVAPEYSVYAVYEDVPICRLRLKLRVEGADMPSDIRLSASSGRSSGYTGGTGSLQFTISRQTRISEQKLIGEIAKTGTIWFSVTAPEAISYYALDYWEVQVDKSSGYYLTYISPPTGVGRNIRLEFSHPGYEDDVWLVLVLHYKVGTFYLRVSVEPSGARSAGCTTYPYGENAYPGGTSVSVTAYDAGDYDFDYWLLNGVNKGSSDSITVYMDGNKTLVAYFKYAPPSYRLTIRVYPSGAGQVTFNPPGRSTSSSDSQTYTKGTTVSIRQSASSGYAFDHWELDGVSYSSLSSVTMDRDHTLKAVYLNNIGGAVFKEHPNLWPIWDARFYMLIVIWPEGAFLDVVRSYLPDAVRVDFTYKVGHIAYDFWKGEYYAWTSIYHLSDYGDTGVVFAAKNYYVEQAIKSGTYGDAVLIDTRKPRILKVWDFHAVLRDGTVVPLGWQGSEAFYIVPVEVYSGIYWIRTDNDVVTSISGWPADPPLAVYYSSGDLTELRPLYCNLTGLALYDEPVAYTNSYNFSLPQGRYTVTAPETVDGMVFSYWIDPETKRVIGYTTALTVDLTKATTVVAVYSAPERSDLGPAIWPPALLAAGLLSRFMLKGRRTRKALSSVMAAIIFLALVFPMVISIILFVPRLNQAIKTSSDVQQLQLERAREQLDVSVYRFDMSTGTVVIQAVNTGSIAITVTDALVINYLDSTPVRYYQFSDGSRSIAIGDVHFFILGPATPGQLSLDPSIPVSQNATAHIESYERICLVSERGNVFPATESP